MRETLWRCTTCGKWSHARRRPKSHQAHTLSGLDSRPLLYDLGYTYEGDFLGYMVKCGPFQRWQAVLVEEC